MAKNARLSSFVALLLFRNCYTSFSIATQHSFVHLRLFPTGSGHKSNLNSTLVTGCHEAR